MLVLHGIGTPDVTGDDESREVGIVQDVLRGHWLWPRFNADLIPDKPTLSHWLAALACLPGGFSETAVRVPSALAGAGLVAWTTRFGMAVAGAPAGVAAGALLATVPTLFSRSRLARPDVLMTLFLSAALGLAFRARRERRSRDATWSLVLLGLATAVKGPVAPALYAATMGVFLLWERDLRAFRALLTLPGVVAALVIGGGWYALAAAGWGEEFVQQHLVGRYLRNLAGGMAEGNAYSPKPLWFHATFYPLHLPLVALPWTPLVVAALVRLWRRGAFASPLVRFLVAWAVAPVVVFTPAEGKLRYYLLPSLPPLMLLAGPLAAELVTRSVGRIRSTRTSLLAAGLLLVAGAGAAWLALARPALLSDADQAVLGAVLAAVPGGAAGAAALVGVALGGAATAVMLRLWGPLVAATGVSTTLWLVAGAPALEQADSTARSLKPFAMEARARFPAEGALAFFGEPVRSVVVYVGHPVRSLARDPERIAAGLGVITLAPAHRRLAAAGRVGEPLAARAGQLANLERGVLVLAEGRGKLP